jgi:hypothetical protein
MGYFIAYDEKGNVERIIPNHFVECGKVAMLDMVFNSTNWMSGADATHFYGNRYMGVGTYSETNAGLNGPSGTLVVSASGTWQGPSEYDYKLSNEITILRPQVVCTRAGKSAGLVATITDDCITDAATQDWYIREVGIFMHNDVGFPEANPIESNSMKDKHNCMLIRGVFYRQDGDNYVEDPLRKPAGSPRIIEYLFADFEG